MKLYHNSQEKIYRDPCGAVQAGTPAALALQIAEAAPNTSCTLNLWRDGRGAARIPMKPRHGADGTRLFSADGIVSWDTGLIWYYFIVTLETGSQVYYGNNQAQLGGEGQVYDHIPPAFQITVYKPAPVPAWYKASIVYQLFPDRFARSADWMDRQAAADKGSGWKGPKRVIQQCWEDTPYYTKDAEGRVTRWPFFGGTLQGIRDHLLYLKSMGADAIYLNPIFSAASNHKYDTADYLQIDPAFGTEEDFRLLAKDAGRLGIRLILDGVFNHTGADSKYFNSFGNYPGAGAYQGSDSPFYNWYRFSRFPDEYQCWWGVTDLPAVDETNAEYQSFIYGDKDSVVRYWLRQGASGWRLDVADELPGSFITGIRSAIKETEPEGVLLGEVWEDASNKISYGTRRHYLLGEELDSAMNYPARDLLADYMLGNSSAQLAVRRLRSLAENYPPESFYSALNLIGSHDRARILTLLGDAPADLSDGEKEAYRLPGDKRQLAAQRLKLLSLLQFVLPGVPSVYYGDEAGAQGYEDPYNRGTYPWGREDPDLLAHYRMLAALRKQYRFLADGAYAFSWQGEHVLICRRWQASTREWIIAIINRHLFGGAAFDLTLPQDPGYVLELLTSTEMTPENKTLRIQMPALSCMLLYCGESAPRPLTLRRGAGVLCHVSSLASGRLDQQAEGFIDFLARSGQSLWQILPLNPTYPSGKSPYASPAVFAGNLNLGDPACKVDMDGYHDFCKEEAYWLDDFALFTALKERFEDKPWQHWPKAARNRTELSCWLEKERHRIQEIKLQQYRFWNRWMQIKAYANARGISVIGDLPIYVAQDSVDTWAHREYFLLDDSGQPLAGAGVPPDYFNENGQNWGNPLYDWTAMEQDGYAWWEKRISQAMARYDYVRLDHFRSFSAFYAIPRGKTALEGWWLPGPGKHFFETLTEKLGSLPLLAEDLGLLDNQVSNLLKLSGYPGMLVYQFSREEMASITGEEAGSRIFYTGTHDNQTLAGWCRENSVTPADPNGIIELLYKSPAPWVVTPLQDLLGLGDESRMNTPGDMQGNWEWQVSSRQLSPELSARLRKWASESGR